MKDSSTPNPSKPRSLYLAFTLSQFLFFSGLFRLGLAVGRGYLKGGPAGEARSGDFGTLGI